MAKATDKRSFNNANLSPTQVMGLKKKATAQPRVTLRVGSKTIDLPIEVQLLDAGAGGQYAFISVPPINAVCGKTSTGHLEAVHVSELDQAVAALKAVRQSTKGVRRAKSSQMTISDDLAAALKLLPKGYKLVAGPGGYRLAKSREKATK